MTSVFKLHPEDLKKKMIYLYNLDDNLKIHFTFLDKIKEKYDINVLIYYSIIDSIEEFKLKNIFYFINLRLKKIGERINYDNVTKDNINNIFNDYIKGDIVKSIMIMNLIQQYIYPLRS